MKLARAKAPGSIDAMLALARYYGDRGELTQAQDQIQIAFRLEPGNLEVQTARAENLESQAKFAEAEQALKGAISLAPGLAKPHIAMGYFQSNRKNWDAATAEYRKSLAIEPTNGSAFLGLVNIDLDPEVYRPQDALKQAEEWVKVAPEGQVSAMSTLGEVKRINGDYAGSAEAYQVAINRLPGVIDSYVGLSQTQRAQAKFGDAIQLLNRATAIAPGNVSVYQSRALAQYAIGQSSAAMESYRQASEADKSSASAYVSLARDAYTNNQVGEGLQFYQQAMAVQPVEFSAYSDLIKLYLESEDPDSALVIAQKARQLIPAGLDPRLQLAQAQEAEQDQVAALNTLNEALVLFPNEQGLIYSRIGDVYSKFKNTDAAITAYRTAQTLPPALIDPWLGEGDVYLLQRDDSKTALTLYQKAVEIDGQAPEVYAKILAVYGKERNGRPTLEYDSTCPDDHGTHGCRKNVTGVNRHTGLDSVLKAQYEANAAAQPDSLEAQISLGVMYQAYRLYDPAIATWKHVLSLDPANQAAYAALSYDYALGASTRLEAATAMGQYMALGMHDLGADDRGAFRRLATLYNDQMTSIPDGATFGSKISIQGTANGQVTDSTFPFSYYKVEVGVGTDPQDWTVIKESSTPVTDGELAVWDTSGWQNGTYTLRLVIVDTKGDYRTWDQRTIHLQHSTGSGG